jgi:catechol 2,3-dioxygenase-like lactoylglutathione lyase family enzyme
LDPKGDIKMITGAHIIIYSKDADADRAFFRDVLGFDSADAGRGWLVFALPPSEAAFHPDSGNNKHELYLMCKDIKSEVTELKAKGAQCSELNDEPWGILTTITLPGGGEIGLYQPKHTMAIKLK